MAFAATQSALLRKAVDADGSDMMDNQTILYISLSFGMSLLVSAWVFFRYVVRISPLPVQPAHRFAPPASRAPRSTPPCRSPSGSSVVSLLADSSS